MVHEITEDRIKCEKLKLHITYIGIMAVMCVVSVIILSFCEDTMFKNCVSVASTVTSIILSVIAIILSVTGERTTNEIRNRVSDSVEQLEACAEKSEGLATELTDTLKQLNELYKNVNERILSQLPEITGALTSDCPQNDDNSSLEKDYIKLKIESISVFLGVLPEKVRSNIKESLKYVKTEIYDNKKTVSLTDIAKNLVTKGVGAQEAMFATGITIGYMSAGIFNYDGLSKLIEKVEEVDIKKQD